MRLDALERQSFAQAAQIVQLREQFAELVRQRASQLAQASLAEAPQTTAPATIPAAQTRVQQQGTASVAPPQQTAQQPDGAVPQPRVTAPPRSESTQSVYENHNAVFTRRLTVTPEISHAYSDNQFFSLNGFLALGAVFLGNINATRQESSADIYSLSATYGVLPRLQLEAAVPYFNRSSTFYSAGANYASSALSQEHSHSSGLGDVEVGGYYQLRSESERWPSVVLSGHLSLPTGRAPYGIKLLTDPANNNAQYPSSLPTGAGTLGYQLGASFVKTSDPAIFFGNVSYYLYQQRHFADISTSPSVMQAGFAAPGNAYQYQVGTAFSLNDKTSLSFAFADTVAGQLRLAGDGESSITSIGSATNAASFDVGTSFSSTPQSSLVLQFGFGLTKDAPNFQVDVRLPRRW